MAVKKPTEKSENERSPKRLYIKIPKDYYTSSKAEQFAFLEALIAQVKKSSDEQGAEEK